MQSPFAYARPDLNVITPTSVEEAAEAIRRAAADGTAVLARGGGTKWSAGCQPSGKALIVSSTGLNGILEYEPGELTFTARAGTPVADIEKALAANGQYLPFDPPFVAQGATLGGAVAAGLSGPRRMRYGGLRDFVLGIEYLNGKGEIVHGGGKVVKNAAGYDFPKLFCGSLGTLGFLTRLSFKVFPLPERSQTLVTKLKTARDVQAVFRAIQHSRIEVNAADAWPDGVLAAKTDSPNTFTLAVQVNGASTSLPSRMDALRKLLAPTALAEFFEGIDESALWEKLRDVAWAGDANTILRLYLPPNQLTNLDALLHDQGARYVFSAAGNVGWAALKGDPGRLSPALARLGVRATVWRAPDRAGEVLPALPGAAIVRRVKAAFDPDHVFYPGRYAVG